MIQNKEENVNVIPYEDFMLPSIHDQAQVDDIRKKLENFNKIIHRNLNESEVKSFKGKFDYMPIDFMEMKADRIFFGMWKWELLWEPKLIVNEIQVCGRFHFLHPTIHQWLFRDGIGVAQIRFQKNTDWTDISNKIQNSLQLDIPHAEADAMKSAMMKLGNSFGRNLRRNEVSEYEPMYKQEALTLSDDDLELIDKLTITIEEFQDPKELLKKKNKLFDIKISSNGRLYLERIFQAHYDKLLKDKNG